VETKSIALWKEACTYLAGTLSKDVYDRWIAVIDARGMTEDTLSLSVANDFYQSWLEENYLPLIRKAIATVTGREYAIELQVDSSQPAPAPAASQPEAPKKSERKSGGGKARNTIALNPKYSFENFVVGASNNFAHAASLAVAQSPARAYNPLFIYGGVGLGKTHLMQAIGQYANVHSKLDICYISSETLLNDYVEALQNHGVTQFRKKYRGMGMLLIDDIQFLAGKERMQEEFFHTFNALHENHRQIVLTSDRPASELAGLDARLVSRFEWGLVTELEMPDVETRIAILRKKQEQLHLRLPDDVILYMAERIRSNIRRLEGGLIRVASYASLNQKDVTVDMVEYLLRDTLDQEQSEALTIVAVQRVVAEYYDIRLGDMTSKQRPQSVAFPRQVAMYLCRTLTQNSLPAIGNAFGRNHATVMHACKQIDGRMKEDPSFRQAVSTLKQKLGQR